MLLATDKTRSIDLIWEIFKDLLTLVKFPNQQSSGSNGKCKHNV